MTDFAEWISLENAAALATVLMLFVTIGAMVWRRMRGGAVGQHAVQNWGRQANPISLGNATIRAHNLIVGNGSIQQSSPLVIGHADEPGAKHSAMGESPGRSNSLTAGQAESLVHEVEARLARHDEPVSELVLSAYRLAKHSGDDVIARWLEHEMDGYEESDLGAIGEEYRGHRVLDAYFVVAGQNVEEDLRLPYKIFEAKPVSRIEDAWKKVQSTGSPLTVIIPTPSDIRTFFEKEALGVNVPPYLSLVIEAGQFAALLGGVRKRIRQYLSTRTGEY